MNYCCCEAARNIRTTGKPFHTNAPWAIVIPPERLRQTTLKTTRGDLQLEKKHRINQMATETLKCHGVDTSWKRLNFCFCSFQMYGGYVISTLLVFTWLCLMAAGVHSAVSEKESGMEKVRLTRLRKLPGYSRFRRVKRRLFHWDYCPRNLGRDSSFAIANCVCCWFKLSENQDNNSNTHCTHWLRSTFLVLWRNISKKKHHTALELKQISWLQRLCSHRMQNYICMQILWCCLQAVRTPPFARNVSYYLQGAFCEVLHVLACVRVALVSPCFTNIFLFCLQHDVTNPFFSRSVDDSDGAGQPVVVARLVLQHLPRHGAHVVHRHRAPHGGGPVQIQQPGSRLPLPRHLLLLHHHDGVSSSHFIIDTCEQKKFSWCQVVGDTMDKDLCLKFQFGNTSSQSASQVSDKMMGCWCGLSRCQ